MSALTTIEKARLEELFEMGGGYVLDFTNDKFAEFFRDNAKIDIYDNKYALNGGSKAKRLRAFWELEPDPLVGKVLFVLLEYWHFLYPTPDNQAKSRADSCKKIVERLLGRGVTDPADSEQEFLDRDFQGVSFDSIPIEDSMKKILKARYSESETCLKSGAPLAAIFMTGSILEGLLLGVACAHPQKFNQAISSPKDPNTGQVRKFPEWKLAQFIDVACELKFLSIDVKKFSHALRDFRNYIHPYQQMASGFAPDNHTAKICIQVLRAAIASLANQRQG